MKKRTFRSTFVLLLSASLTVAQTPNQAAVDTLTKDVAVAVFSGISQPKAQEIYAQLLDCGDGCDPQQVIRGVGSWDQVGVKMQELATIKNTATFAAMSPADANTAIRKQFAQFYAKYKSDKNYGKPLNPAVQAQLLAKLDGLLPPAIAPEPTANNTPAVSGTAADEETSITPEALQLSQLERQAKAAAEKQLWMMILGAIAGLIVGAGAVYLLAYRSLKNEVDRLSSENTKLSHQYDSLRNKTILATNEPRPTNEPRQPQGDLRQKATAYDAIIAELGPGNPLMTIRQLKQRGGSATAASTVGRSGEPVVEPNAAFEVAPVQVQPSTVQTPPIPIEAPLAARSEVFYFPPPDPTGQFDSQQKSASLSPESAYRFSINANNPPVASFRFEAETGRVARFLTYRNYMVEPACESENSYTPTHTRITMRRDGEAVLENGVWRVKTKALIRYE